MTRDFLISPQGGFDIASTLGIVTDPSAITGIESTITFIRTMGTIPPIHKFIFENMKPVLTKRFANNFATPYEVSIFGAKLGLVSPVKVIHNESLNRTTIYFVNYAYNSLKYVHITKSWQETTLNTVFNDIIAKVNESLQAKEKLKPGFNIEEVAIAIKNLHFDNWTALRCLEYLSEKYGYLLHYTNTFVMFEKKTSSAPVSQQLDVINHKRVYENLLGFVGDSYRWVRINLAGTKFSAYVVSPNSNIKVNNSETVWKVHTIIYNAKPKRNDYIQMLLINPESSVSAIKEYSTDVPSQLPKKLKEMIRREISANRQIGVGEVTNYQGGNLVDFTVGYDSSFKNGFLIDGSLETLDITPGQVEMKNRPVLTTMAGDGFGHIIPCYEGERLLVAKIDNGDVIVLGKIFKTGDTPPATGNIGDVKILMPAGADYEIDCAAGQMIKLGGGTAQLAKANHMHTQYKPAPPFMGDPGNVITASDSNTTKTRGD